MGDGGVGHAVGMQLRPYQQSAVSEAAAVFAAGGERFTVVLPCGTGKTVVAVAAAASAELVVLCVPTVALLEQTAQVWAQARPDTAQCWVTAARPDSDVDDVTPPPAATTDPDVVAERIRGSAGSALVVLSTYASAQVVADACAQAGATVDFLVCDEAHRLAGLAGTAWQAGVEAIPARRRLFLTATPREVSAGDDARDEISGELLPVASMDDPAVYGPRFAPLALREAIREGWLSDYRIAVVAVDVDDPALAAGIKATSTGELVDMEVAAAQIALLRYAATHPQISSVLAFSNRVAASAAWADQWEAITGSLPADARPAGPTEAVHIDGTMPQSVRRDALAGLAAVGDGGVQVVTNCRVLSEGVDVPSLDAVLFAQPRTSAPDIIQIVGRALRKHPRQPNRKAVIIVPALYRAGERASVETVVARTPFFAAWQVLTALAHEDSALYKTLARLAANLPAAEDTDGEDVDVEIDVDALPAEAAQAFRLRLLNRTTNPWAVCAVHVRDHLLSGGTSTPGARFVRHGYPLGQRVREVRSLWRADKLPERIVALFDAIPGWQWQPGPSRVRRSVDDWIALCAAHTALTGMATIRPWEVHQLPDGSTAAVGAWLDRLAPHRLSPDQRAALIKAVPDWSHPARARH